MEAVEELVERFINHTNQNIFLTGKAGTGKTTLIKNIVKNTHKKTLVVAPSGIAALNVGGVTIHSQFQIPFTTFIPERRVYQLSSNVKVESQSTITRNIHYSNDKKRILNEAELLVIDEVSMLRADLLDAVDYLLKYIRKNNKAFGGIQVLLCGDMLQLPPIVKDEEWEILSKYYRSIYFFSALVLQKNKLLKFELETVHRQKDLEYTALLNSIRSTSLREEDLEVLNSRCISNFNISEFENLITLTTHNAHADNINKLKLSKIDSPEEIFNAELKGDFPEHLLPVEKKLVLKVGAQIMFVKNDSSSEKLYYNGKIGIIDSIIKDKIIVLTQDGIRVEIKMYEWSNIKYSIDASNDEIEERIVGTYKQYPIKLAWAITIHKSQGLTFEKAIIDIKNVFASGQIYVALSRIKTLEGLFLSTKIEFNNIKYSNDILNFESQNTKEINYNNEFQISSSEYVNEFVINTYNLSDTMKYWNDYLISLSEKDDKYFLDYKIWFLEVYKLIEIEYEISVKFVEQIHKIINQKNYNQLLDRIEQSENYFIPKLKGINNRIADFILSIERNLDLMEEIPDLLALQNINLHKINKIIKSKLITQHFLSSKILVKDCLKESLIQSWDHQLPSAITKKKKSKTSTTLSKTKRLFKAGLSPEQISAKRKLKLATILSHIKLIKEEFQMT